MLLDPVINFGKVQVSIGYDASATSIVLSTGDGAKFPSTFSYNVIWWNFTDYSDPADDPNVEIVRVTARSTDTLTVTRAQEGTGASTKNTSSKTYKMLLGITKKMIDDLHPRYALQVATGATNPPDSTTLFAGSVPSLGWVTTSTLLKVYIPKAGTIKAIYSHWLILGSNGSSETSILSFRLNDTTDTVISSLITNDSPILTFSNTGLSIPVVQGDYFELKWVTPAWVTNPTNLFTSATIYIE